LVRCSAMGHINAKGKTQFANLIEKKNENLINRRDQKHPPLYIVLCHPERERDKPSNPSEISRALPSFSPNSHTFSSYFPLFSLLFPNSSYSLMATTLYSTHCRSLATSSSSFQPCPFSSHLPYLPRVTFSQRFLASGVSLKSQPQSYQIPVHTQQQEGFASFSSSSSSYTLLFLSFKFGTFF